MRWSKTKETFLILIIGLAIVYRLTGRPILLWFAGTLLLIGLFAPSLANKIHKAWMALAEALGFIMSRCLLTVIFFLVLMPLGFLSRILGKNDLIVSPKDPSSFTTKKHLYTKDDLQHPW